MTQLTVHLRRGARWVPLVGAMFWVIKGRAGRRVRRVVPRRGDVVGPRHRHPAPRSLLLSGSGDHVALGTALGDVTANTPHLGYPTSAVLYAAVIAVIGLAFGLRLIGPTFAFWAAYVMTRPLGASLADWFGKPTDEGGLGVGAASTSLVLAAAIVVLVGVVTVRRSDMPSAD